jgi:hypothetical protein
MSAAKMMAMAAAAAALLGCAHSDPPPAANASPPAAAWKLSPGDDPYSGVTDLTVSECLKSGNLPMSRQAWDGVPGTSDGHIWCLKTVRKADVPRKSYAEGCPPGWTCSDTMAAPDDPPAQHLREELDSLRNYNSRLSPIPPARTLRGAPVSDMTIRWKDTGARAYPAIVALKLDVPTCKRGAR